MNKIDCLHGQVGQLLRGPNGHGNHRHMATTLHRSNERQGQTPQMNNKSADTSHVLYLKNVENKAQVKSVSSKGSFVSRFTCSQAYQGSTPGCDYQQWTSLAWLSHGKPASTEITRKPGCSYQGKLEKIPDGQHKKNRRGANHSRPRICHWVRDEGPKKKHIFLRWYLDFSQDCERIAYQGTRSSQGTGSGSCREANVWFSTHVKSISSQFFFVVPRLCNVAQPFLLSDEQIISLIYLRKLLKKVPRVCNVAQPLFFVEKRWKTRAFPLSQGCAKLRALFFCPAGWQGFFIV